MPPNGKHSIMSLQPPNAASVTAADHLPSRSTRFDAVKIAAPPSATRKLVITCRKSTRHRVFQSIRARSLTKASDDPTRFILPQRLQNHNRQCHCCFGQRLLPVGRYCCIRSTKVCLVCRQGTTWWKKDCQTSADRLLSPTTVGGCGSSLQT